MNILEQLLNRLKERTEKEEYKWKSLPEYLGEKSNEALRSYVIDKQRSYYNASVTDKGMFLDESSSYCLPVNGGLIGVVTYVINTTKFFVLIAQKDLSGKICELNVIQEYQNELTALITILKDKVDNINEFIKEIIK